MRVGKTNIGTEWL